jgi:PhzF family phenazine biosynthesis protein
MKKINFSVIDAFTNKPFTGNPAACVVTEEPLDEKTMQNIAMEMNLSETAFTVPLKNKKNEFQLRWFTPTREVPLCGHATLAMAHYLKSISDKSTEFLFHTLSGALAVTFDKEEITMDFPSAPLNLITDDVQELNDWLESILLTDEFKILGTANQYLFVELKDQTVVQALDPVLHLIKELPYLGVSFSSLGDSGIDYVCRFFAPAAGIAEDPVTGSAHAVLGPHYAQELDKKEILGLQLSKRGGRIKVRPENMRVFLSGQAVTIYQAEMNLKE